MTLSLFHLPLQAIGVKDIQALIDAEQVEHRQLDYKKELPNLDATDRKDQKFDFLCDVSALANSSGGDIVFGVIEDENHKPEGIVPINVTDLDETERRLNQIIMANTEPTIVGIDWQPIKVQDPDGYLLILRVRKSFNGPHQVCVGRQKFYARNSKGNYPMDYQQLRNAFIGSHEIIQQMRNWRDQRLSQVRQTGDVQPGPRVLIHLLPLGFQSLDYLIVPERMRVEFNNLAPLGSNDWAGRHNIDGYWCGELVELSPGLQKSRALVQMFRSGQIESVANLLCFLSQHPSNRSLLGRKIEDSILQAIQTYLPSMQRAGVAPPIFVSISFQDVKNYELIIPKEVRGGDQLPLPIERNDFTVPEVLLTEYPSNHESLAKQLKLMMDCMWNASGYTRSEAYDQDGNRIRKIGEYPVR
jgi:hypothetical protein